jgi:hypothetical protein
MQGFRVQSEIRLPFEPKGEAIALKDKIRSCLKTLNPSEYSHLKACLTTGTENFFDVENILLYNVGTGAFTHLNLDELSFSLNRDSKKSKIKYTYSYELISEEEQAGTCDTILEFCFHVEKVTSSMKPLDYWYDFKHGIVKITEMINPEELGLAIVIEMPEKHRNIVSLVKPIIDGIISSFHYQESATHEVIAYIAEQKQISEKEVSSLLTGRDWAFLGERDIVSKFRTGLKWNPEDEKCTRVNLKQIIGSDNQVKVYGKAYKLK